MTVLNKSNSGFTLIELMLAVGIISFFLIIIYNFFNMGLKFLGDQNNESSSYLEARVAVDRITLLLRNYEKLEITSPGVVSGYSYGYVMDDSLEPEELINFYKNTDNNTSIVDNYKYYYYYPTGSNYGKILNNDGGIIAEGIIYFNIVDKSTYLNLELEVIPVDTLNETPLKLYTSIDMYRKNPIEYQ